MPQPPPPVEGCLRAWELYSLTYPWRHVAEILRSEGYKCSSHETARQWGEKGKDLSFTQEALDRGGQRARMADGLEQDMAALREEVRLGISKASDVMAHLKWLYRERARLIGTDAPTQTQVSLTDERAPVDPETAAQVRAAEAEAVALEQSLRNGRP